MADEDKDELEELCDAMSSFEHRLGAQAKLSTEYDEPPFVAGALTIVLRISIALRLTLRQHISPAPASSKPPAAAGRRPR